MNKPQTQTSNNFYSDFKYEVQSHNTPNMAPPGAKRRKLSHSDSNEDEDIGFSRNDVNGANALEDVEEVDSYGSDDSTHRNSMPEEDNDTDMDIDDGDGSEEEEGTTARVE